MAYFERLGATTFRATDAVSGAWREDEQHIAPALGLLAHLVEVDHHARRGDLVIARLSYDILGTMAVDVVETSVAVLRAGRTIELVEARMSQAGRDTVLLRAWLLDSRDTAALAGTPLPRLPDPDDVPAWPATSSWPGGFIRSAQVRRALEEPGRGRVWVRTEVPLLDEEEVSPLAATAGLLDIANGMSMRVDPGEVLFPNLDLTAHFFRTPVGGWLGLDTSVSFGERGIGLTSSVLHDAIGPLGTLAQSLTVRPLPRPTG